MSDPISVEIWVEMQGFTAKRSENGGDSLKIEAFWVSRGLLKDLTKACQGSKPEIWLEVAGTAFPADPFEGKLKAKTCQDSALELFIYGQRGGRALKISHLTCG